MVAMVTKLKIDQDYPIQRNSYGISMGMAQGLFSAKDWFLILHKNL